jgi:hypothetical protein
VYGFSLFGANLFWLAASVLFHSFIGLFSCSDVITSVSDVITSVLFFPSDRSMVNFLLSYLC